MRRALFACLIALTPSTASAWTDAVVRSVHAEVRIDGGAEAHVTVTATVRVHGGWLEGLEVAGLDPDLALDEDYEPWALGSDGEPYTPRVVLGRRHLVQISFPGRSPRRGEVRVGFAYRTSLAHRATAPVEGEPRVRVQWTLPGWRAGLDGVRIDLHVPSGSVPGPSEVMRGTSAELSLEVEREEEGTVLRFWRAHLPRTLPWMVSADVPAELMDPELRGAPVARPPPPPRRASPTAERDPTLFWMALPALVGVLALAQMGFVSARARRARSWVRPALVAPTLVRAALVLAAVPVAATLGLSGFTWSAIAVLAGISLMAMHLPGRRPAQSKLGAWRPVDARWLRAARRSRWRRWGHPEAWLDASTLPGLLHVAGWLALPWLYPEPPVRFDVLLLVAVVPLPILLTGGWRAFVRPPTDVLRCLLAFARALRALPDGVALRPVMHVAVDGDVQDARVRLVLARRAEGLLRLDLALGHVAHAGGWSAAPMWLVLTRAGSPADVALRALSVEAVESRGGRRVVRCARASDETFLARALELLSVCPEAREPVRGVAAPAETVRDLPAPHAVGF